MIDFGLFQFAAAPRTGTTWVQKACFHAGMGEHSKAGVHDPFPLDNTKGTPRVSCIRHPCDWLVSYFTSIYPGFLGIEAVDVFRKFQTTEFDRFIRNYLKRNPGAVGKMFLAYNADFMLRTEQIGIDFEQLLEMLGISTEVRARCAVISVANRAVKRKPLWNKQLRQYVLEAEADFMNHYGYALE